MRCHISHSRVLLLVLHISYDPDHIVPVAFHAYAPGWSQTQFIQSSHCISEETEAWFVASLPKVTTDKYQELGFGLLAQGCDAFSSIYLVSA